MKKFITLILVLIFTVICTTACSSKTDDTVTAPATSEVVETQTTPNVEA